MIPSLSFHEAAEAELNEAAEYYELKVSGLGLAFLLEAERVTAGIQQQPQSAPRIWKVVRRRLLRRFPYSVMYSFVGNHIRILAIAHQKRRPFYWRARK